MATLTTTDMTNASRYAAHMHRLNYITRWRNKMPHILIDYEIRPATEDDYYIPPKLVHKAIAVKLKFSKRGCESMSCYPFTETGVVDATTQTNATQTSETTVLYAQPACYHLDRPAATREGAENKVQAPELRYLDTDKRCILVDTLSKMYLNSPYLRTDDHLIQGVDDVPAFNVQPGQDPLFPEMFDGTFNQAYCRRFGRDLMNGGCTSQWWESLIGFVLGDTILITFKLLTNNIFSELRNFDYTRPSPILPLKPVIDSETILNEWRNIRDNAVNLEFEAKFAKFQTLSDFGIDRNTKLLYTAEVGFSKQTFQQAKLTFRKATTQFDYQTFNIDDQTLDQIISQFLQDYSLILGIATDIGFDLLLTQFKEMLKRINMTLIPALKKMLLQTSKRITTKLLGETFKAAIVQQFNRIAIKTISAVAKALTKIAIKASSVVGIILIIFTISDLVLSLWDPFGYSNMFPPEFPRDLSRSFLSAYFETIGDGSRDMIEFLPEFFDELVEDDDTVALDSLLYILDYITALEVNSNGQLLNLDEGETVDDIDETTLLGNALSSSSLYTRLEFLQYTKAHNRMLFGDLVGGDEFVKRNDYDNLTLAVLWAMGALLLFIMPDKTPAVVALFVIFLLMTIYLLILGSIKYFARLHFHVKNVEVPWFQFLYM